MGVYCVSFLCIYFRVFIFDDNALYVLNNRIDIAVFDLYLLFWASIHSVYLHAWYVFNKILFIPEIHNNVQKHDLLLYNMCLFDWKCNQEACIMLFTDFISKKSKRCGYAHCKMWWNAYLIERKYTTPATVLWSSGFNKELISNEILNNSIK